MKTSAIVLASGLSRRFGDVNKLLHPLQGKPLAAYIAETVRGVRVDCRIAVVPENQPALKQLFSSRGFECVENPDPAAGQGRSLSLGVKAALAQDCERVVVILADMPFIPLAHIEALIGASDNADAVMTVAGERTMPPSVFKGRALSQLMSLTGDQGARQIDFSAYLVETMELALEYARDFDQPFDFPDPPV